MIPGFNYIAFLENNIAMKMINTGLRKIFFYRCVLAYLLENDRDDIQYHLLTLLHIMIYLSLYIF